MSESVPNEFQKMSSQSLFLHCFYCCNFRLGLQSRSCEIFTLESSKNLHGLRTIEYVTCYWLLFHDRPPPREPQPGGSRGHLELVLQLQRDGDENLPQERFFKNFKKMFYQKSQKK